MKGADIIAVLLLGTGKGIDRTNQRSFAGRIYGADCQGGSRQANTAVYSFALSILKNTSDAEDALHDCFLDIYQAAEHYRPQGKPMAWIFTIVRNRCLQKLRERTRTADIPSEDWEPYLQSRESITPEDRLLIGTCMERLNQQERQIVVLHAVSGFRHREIAQLLQLPLPTVLSKYHRALKKLKKYVTEGGER